jgi:hypothetical protein
MKRSIAMPMSTQQIATRLADLCRKGEFEAAQRELFAPAIIEKGHKWSSMVEQVHGCTASAPLIAGNTIAMTLAMDITMKGRERMKMEEVGVYQVKDGKITSEQFFI